MTINPRKRQKQLARKAAKALNTPIVAPAAYSSGSGAPPERARSSWRILSMLKRRAEAVILPNTSSKSNSVALEKRVGLTRATTKALR